MGWETPGLKQQPGQSVSHCKAGFPAPALKVGVRKRPQSRRARPSAGPLANRRRLVEAQSCYGRVDPFEPHSAIRATERKLAAPGSRPEGRREIRAAGK